MDQLTNFADDRLMQGCVYCGASAPETRDHVPSRVLLDAPLPPNLPVVPCCHLCNRSFSRDEEYVASLIECVLSGTTDPDALARDTVAIILRRSAGLRALLESQRVVLDGTVGFTPSSERVAAVVRKLAAGHAAYELARANLGEPTALWCLPLMSMEPDQREQFETPPAVETFGEVGSRGMQRMVIAQFAAVDGAGHPQHLGLMFNGWVEVQDGRYRYLAVESPDGVLVRFVIAEYLAAEVVWMDEDIGAAPGDSCS